MLEVKIVCKGSDLMAIDDMLPFQHDLKSLSDINYLKIKLSITDLGFSEPICIWKNKGKNYIIGGHQRHIALRKMRDEGYNIPLIPVSFVEADNEQQAKRKVLALTSQFGEMSQDGLKDFCEKNSFDVNEILKDFRFPEISIFKIENLDIDDLSIDFNKKFIIEISCKNENDQKEKYEQLTNEGYQCKVLTL